MNRALRRALEGSESVDCSQHDSPNDVPLRHEGVECIGIGAEAVLVDGWNKALVVNATGAAIWNRLDGSTSLKDLSDAMAAELGADPFEVANDVLRFLGRIRAEGFLESDGAEVSYGNPSIVLTAIPSIGPGSVVAALDGFEGANLDVGRILEKGRTLLVKWNPHCGYCAAIAPELSGLWPIFEQKNINLVLLSIGEVDAKRLAAEGAALADRSSLPIVFGPIELDPFPSVGTPSAYYFEGNNRVVCETAHGSVDVLALAQHLSGTKREPQVDEDGRTIQYLNQRGGMCGTDLEPDSIQWSSTRVYRINGHHVGVRIDSEGTGEVLDRLFQHSRVEDPRAGHSFSLSLAGWLAAGDDRGAGLSRDSDNPCSVAPDGRVAVRPLNLLRVNGEGGLLRSRDPARVLRALLLRLDSDLEIRVARENTVSVIARAVVKDGQAVLLPSAVDGFAPRLQAILARSGFATVDVQHPVVDLATGQLIVEAPLVSHDADVVATLTADRGLGASERQSVLPGRYPLRAWCVMSDMVRHVSDLTPAEAAAAAISSVLDTADLGPRLLELGAMFARGSVRGMAMWYDSEADLIEVLRNVTAVALAPEQNR